MEKNLKEMYPLVMGADNELLRRSAQPVVLIDKQIRALARDMVELMWLYDGVWLAAPQIGHSLRIFAYTQRDTSKKKRALLEEGVMINPKLVHVVSETSVDKEGCLSLPGVQGEVARPISVTMSYMDLSGKQQIKKATGYNARILLHELDHLDGVLFIDKATRLREKK